MPNTLTNTERLDKVWEFIDDTLRKPKNLEVATAAGFPKKQFENAKKQYEQIVSDRQVVDLAMAERKEATRVLNETINELKFQYNALVEMGRRMFKNDPKTWDILNLTGERKGAYGEMKHEINSFYSVLMADEQILAQYASQGVPKETLEAQVKLYKDMIQLKREQDDAEDKRAEAQQVWSQAFQELDTWCNYAEKMIAAWKRLKHSGK